MSKIDKNSIGITAIGMVTSLGHTAALSCAAAHAGLVRSSELDYEILDEEELEI